MIPSAAPSTSNYARDTIRAYYSNHKKNQNCQTHNQSHFNGFFH